MLPPSISQFDGSPEAFATFKFDVDLEIASRDDLSDREKLTYFFRSLTPQYKSKLLMRLCPSSDYQIIFRSSFDTVYDHFKRQFQSYEQIRLSVDQSFRNVDPLPDDYRPCVLRDFIENIRPIAAPFSYSTNFPFFFSVVPKQPLRKNPRSG